MQSLNSRSALACELICLTITFILLFYNVLFGSEAFSITHIYIVLGLVVALGAGTYMEGFRRQPLLSTMFFVFFVVGTIFCVAMSGSRSAAVYEENDRSYKQLVNDKATLKTRVTEAQTSVAGAEATYKALDAKATKLEDEATAECATGKGSRCDGRTQSARDERAKALASHASFVEATRLLAEAQSRYDAMHVPAPSNPELRSFAQTLVLLFGGDVDHITDVLKRLLPYFLALLAEGATLAFHKKAWGPAQRAQVLTKHVTIGDIAHDLRINDRTARKIVRELAIAKPAEGWVWERGPASEAIKIKIQQAISTTH